MEIHRSVHNDMLSIPDYVVSNESTRVRKLLTNIKSTNPILLASIASVQTSATLQNNFEQAVDTLQSAVCTTKVTIARKQRISALTGGRGNRGGRGGQYQRGKRGRNEDVGRAVVHMNVPVLKKRVVLLEVLAG